MSGGQVFGMAAVAWALLFTGFGIGSLLAIGWEALEFDTIVAYPCAGFLAVASLGALACVIGGVILLLGCVSEVWRWVW